MTVYSKNGFTAQENISTATYELLVLNLMPNKKQTELQIRNVLQAVEGNINLTFMYPLTHQFKSISSNIISEKYAILSDIENKHFDGLIVTGAPVEQLEFEDVDYWGEFCDIIAWAQKKCDKVLCICWAAQAAMYQLAAVPKKTLPDKLFGIYTSEITVKKNNLFTDIKIPIKVPFSRYTTNNEQDVIEAGFDILATNTKTGPMVAATKDGRYTFITGHPEYGKETLFDEYQRDLNKDLKIAAPHDYFVRGNGTNVANIVNTWSYYSQRLFANWLQSVPISVKL
ncbi:homoserine O-succinyltransferase [Ligilactobacillus sp. WILCCON 0076]|uniref:Homoserine O-acetyltransferase n=1 Tax=Ligilactobacillus ubinensis TaxID=2876789 RepID=A0A9X2JKM5_9LACO|nr:homoserine O-succinyltransferase [Ligilactobacillus ubinensis]MCP0886184.1 homoserine O-succinyltransferase [Ligilactobacillus ubinensis]